MCEKHNIYQHDAGFDITRLDDGSIRIMRPDGSVLAVPDAA